MGENKKHLETNFLRNMVSVLTDDHWRRVRAQITPAFTTGKLKKVPSKFKYKITIRRLNIVSQTPGILAVSPLIYLHIL